MEVEDKACTLDLSLELGLGGYVPKKEKQKSDHITFSKGEEDLDVLDHDKANGFNFKRVHEEEYPRPIENGTNYKNESRKKLRLTNEQSAMLEDTFKLHNTINPAQKRALAEQLNLKQRQVEVWFQNRRARTKLKQTEVNCSFFKKCREKLSDENLRLKKELEELRALKVNGASSPPYTQPSKAPIWTVCSSCKKLWYPSEGNSNNEAISQKGSHKLQRSIEI